MRRWFDRRSRGMPDDRNELGRTSSPTLCRAWRINVAHDLKNVDPVTDVPLAAQVCYNVAGLQFSFQTDTFQDILSYQAGGAVGVGPLLSALCAFMWFTKVRPSPHSAE